VHAPLDGPDDVGNMEILLHFLSIVVPSAPNGDLS
jgi:hypothetical protein